MADTYVVGGSGGGGGGGASVNATYLTATNEVSILPYSVWTLGTMSGTSAWAIDPTAIANEAYNIAIGNGALASGTNSCIAIGRGAYAADNICISIGYNSSSNNNGGVAIGYAANANASQAVAVGASSAATAADAVAIGHGCLATGQNALSAANGSVASGTDAVSLGYNSAVAANYAVGLGNAAYIQSLGTYCLAIGAGAAPNLSNHTGDTGSVAIGYSAECDVINLGEGIYQVAPNVAIGTSSLAKGGGVAIGASASAQYGNTAIGYQSVDFNWNNIVSIGNSTTPRDIVNIRHLISGTASVAPTGTAQTGAGTSPTITIVGTDIAHKITLATGTSVPGGASDILLVTYHTTWPTGVLSGAPLVVLTPGNSAAAGLAGTSGVYVTNPTSGSTYLISVNSAGLASSTTYIWNVLVMM